MDIINIMSDVRRTPFAPEWNYFLVENMLEKIDVKKLSLFLIRKEKSILKLKKTNDGFTGLENHTNTRHGSYNIFSFKNKEIDKLKNKIIETHNEFITALNIKPVKDLYIHGWYNLMRKNEYIKPHAHSFTPDTYLGGHFCVSCENTSTYYINPVNQINNPESYESKNIPGKLTLFNNYVPHYTNKHKAETVRITIAFDLNYARKKESDIKII